MRFHVTAYGVQRAVEEFEGIAMKAADTRPAMEEIYLTILDIEDEAFKNEGARSGFPRWRRHALSTVVGHKGGGKILNDTGHLAEVMTTYRHPDATVRIHKDYIVFAPKLGNEEGSGLPYARVQMFGGHAGGSTIPPRDYLRFSKVDARAFAGEITRHLMRRRGPGKIQVNVT